MFRGHHGVVLQLRNWATTQLFHTSAVCLTNAGVKQVKIMNKLLYGKSKGKRGWYTNPTGGSSMNRFDSAKSLSNPIGVQKHTNRRITVLNSLFMKSITDLMATGSMAESITGLGIEVSRVRVAHDFQNINVYWLAKGSEDDEAIDGLLRKCSGHLRHELSQLRVMGEVPRIHFVKDLEFAKYVEVERILKGADMGLEDAQQVDTQVSYEDSLPEMRHDVFGLPHSIVLSKIQEKLKVTKVAWNQFKSSTDSQSQSADEKESVSDDTPKDLWEAKRLSSLEREQRFAEFVSSQRMGKSKNAASRDDRQFILEQLQGNSPRQSDYQELEEERDTYEEDPPLNYK